MSLTDTRKLEIMNGRLDAAINALSIQGKDGTWDSDQYTLGMFNGMEYVVALMEGRDPVYRGIEEASEDQMYEDSEGDTDGGIVDEEDLGEYTKDKNLVESEFLNE